MTLALDWSGKQAFNEEALRDWHVDGQVAGVTRTAGPLTFVTIAGAGHMVRLIMQLVSCRVVSQRLTSYLTGPI